MEMIRSQRASSKDSVRTDMHMRRARIHVGVIVLLLASGMIGSGVWLFLDRFYYGNASALHRAVMKHDLKRVQALIADHVNLDQTMYAGLFPRTWDATALHLAARDNSVDIVKALLTAGANKNAIDRLGYTPLHGAISEGADDAAQELIRAGADLSAKPGEGQAGYAVENHGQPIRTALESASVQTVKAMIDAGTDIAHDIGPDAMGWIDRRDVQQKIQLLLDYGFSVDGKGPQSRRAIHVAAGKDDVVSLALLLDHGADLEARGGNYALTPLMTAAYAGANKAVTFLVDHGADIHASVENFGSVLYVAAFAGKTDTVRLLLSMKLPIDLQAGRQSDRATPLHMAYWNNDAEMIRMLLDAGADPNARTTDGSLPNQFRKGRPVR